MSVHVLRVDPAIVRHVRGGVLPYFEVNSVAQQPFSARAEERAEYQLLGLVRQAQV